MFRTELLAIQLWQWGSIMLFFVAAYFLSFYLTIFVRWVTGRIILKNFPTFDLKILKAASAPFRMGLAIIIFAIGIEFLKLEPDAYRYFRKAEKFLAILIASWFLFSLVNGFDAWAHSVLEAKGRTSLSSMLALGRRAAKTVIIILAFLTLLQNFGVNVTALLAGLGVGGIAVALASQKTVENLFGGIMIVLDQPIRVGDQCKFGNYEGNIEDIGLRSTRIRTFDRTVICVPNSDFSQMQLENFSLRDQMRIFERFSLPYETSAQQLRELLIELRRLFYVHPMVAKDPSRVRVMNMGVSGLEIEISVYIKTNDSAEFYSIRENIFLQMMDIIEKTGCHIAYPAYANYAAKYEYSA